ncbi:c171bdb1-7fb2-4a41-8577-ba8b1e61fb8e-CDS [Sclerotinia trifoliorum]|uniref:C171bdb1-7fb2-4a41-8577-ba8b1e61fb8e-CDS n=1 Tax=Sclerotinia trifoliorum TaxID=28548 RepID=A0A8H2W2R2_9HELO|nr:c171bdb1-7fb2-4a41-8577-ba8b1e61fb8e-CDS [Sclerotinia trifoliorum]
MGSSACCTSRQPPSPDAVSPRPIRSPSITPANTLRKSPRKTLNLRTAEAQTQVPTWSSATKTEDEPEIRAIFEGQCFPEKDIEEEIKAVGEEDSDEDDEDERQQEVKPMLSSNTLKSVKSRLKKTFSRESGITKNDKRRSIGTSEEEVGRRKELRRLRQKRIEEELSYEDGYDEDAQSMSTVDCPTNRAVDKGKKRQSILPEDSGNFPVFRKQSSSFGSEGIGNGSKISLSTGNVDNASNVSLSVSKLDNTSKVSLLTPADRGKSRTHVGTNEPNINLLKPNTTPPRRYSSPGPCPTPSEIDFLQPGKYRPRKTDSEVCPGPSAPLSDAQRLSGFGIPDTNLASNWRLSYTSHKSNRGAHLRRLSQQFEAPIQSTADIANVGTQTLPRWLKTHGLRSSSQAVTMSEGSTVHQEPSVMRPPRSDTGFGGVDGSGSFTNIHLQDMDISKRLLQSSCSSPQLASWEKHHHEASGISTATQSRARYMRNPSETISIPSCPSFALSELAPPNWGKIPNDGTSSFYPSVANSIQPSPECSRFELSSLVSANRSIVAIVEPQAIDEVITPLRSPIMPAAMGADTPTTINVSLTSLHAPLTRYSARQIDESSLFASETTSFRERELELSYIQARFASSDLRRPPSTPISSKFREEFDISLTPQPKSPFQKLVRACSLKKSRDDLEDGLLLAPPPHRLGFGYRFASTPTTPARKSSTRASTSTKDVIERRQTPTIDDSIDTPVKGRFAAFRRIKRLASIGGYDGPADDRRRSRADSGSRKPSALDARLGLGSEMTAIEAQRKISIPAIPHISLPVPESPSVNKSNARTPGPLARIATSMHVNSPEIHLPGPMARIATSMHIDLPTPHIPDAAASLLHTPHIDLPTPHMPHIPHINVGHHDQDSGPKGKKGPKAAPAIVPIAAPKPRGQKPGDNPQGGAPQWRGPRAKNRSPSREDNRRRMDTSQDDSAAVWMKAVKGAVNDRSKARKDNQDGDDIFGDWEAELAGVASKSKYESRKFGSRGKPKIHHIEQFPKAWCRFPSHERNARGHESAGVEALVEAKDFAALKVGKEVAGTAENSYGTRRRRRPGRNTGNSSDPSSSNALSDEELDAIEAAEPWIKRWSQKIKIAWMDYRIEGEQKKHAFHTGSLGRRGSMTMDGKVPFPELELLPMRAPPPPSEVVDDEADDLEEEKKRVEAIKKAQIKPHYEAADLTQSKAGVSDLLDIFSTGPEEPAEPKMPVKKKGPKARKVKDPYALDEDEDLGGGGGDAEGKGGEGEDGMPKKKEKKAKDPYALDDDDDEDMPPVPKKKGKAKDPYAIDDDMDGSSDFGSGDELGRIDQIVMKEVLSDDDTIDHTRFEDSMISFRDPEFYQDCLVMPKEPSPVHVKECSVLSSHGIIEEEEESPSGNGAGIRVQVQEIGEGVIKQIERFRTWNGKDWEREMGGFLMRRDTSVGRDSMRSAKSGWSMGSQGSRHTVRSVGVEVKRLEDLERKGGLEEEVGREVEEVRGDRGRGVDMFGDEEGFEGWLMEVR